MIRDTISLNDFDGKGERQALFEIFELRYRDILDIPHLLLDQQVTCIVGPSGGGKTSLLRILNRLNPPDSGRVLYNGEDIQGMDPVALRRRVVMLSQTPVLYPGDIRDNLQIGRVFSQKPPLSDFLLRKALCQVGVDKLLDEPCSTLSGGEKQRLCLARVLLMDAETYLLDEPSAALDKKTERAIVDGLAQHVQKSGKQLILVTHSPDIAQRYPNSLVSIGQEKGGETQ